MRKEGGGGFAGLVITINGSDKILLDYLAVTKHRRGQGIGSKLFLAMANSIWERMCFFEIELVRELLGFDCRLTFEEYRDFYRDNYNEWAAEYVKPMRE